jgi:sterol desaturase/sphingolipid hydroxylase (fatty acid hydroxylase superfamily)
MDLGALGKGLGILATAISGIAFLTLERVQSLRFVEPPSRRAFVGSDVAHLVTGLTFGTLTGPLVLAASAALGGLGVPRFAELGVPLWIAAPVALVVLDFGQYVSHRLLHRFDPLWELHKVHHSPRNLDWLAGFRSHLGEHALRRVVAPVGLILLGAPQTAIAIAATVLSTWAAFIHSNVDLHPRALELFLVTPRLHRVHHVPKTTSMNFGAFLTVWDRLSNRFVAVGPPFEAPLGVPQELETYPQTWWPHLVEPLRRIAATRARGRA